MHHKTKLKHYNTPEAVHIVSIDDTWYLPKKWYAKYHGVLCCNGHYLKNSATDHAVALFTIGDWA